MPEKLAACQGVQSALSQLIGKVVGGLLMIKASIIGATGYTGAELVRLLSRHGQVQLVGLTSQSFVGEDITSIYPNLRGLVHKVCQEEDVTMLAQQSDILFIALPHGHSAPVVQEAIARGKKVVDLGADFRLDNEETYAQWYGMPHSIPELLSNAVYGLPELNREFIKKASIVANPGCYPTSVLLGLAPALKRGLVDTRTIIIDAKSGVSGAGRKLALDVHYSQCNESIHAYGVAGHRHTPEIEQELSKLAGEKITVTFTPHLTPMTRGILSTIYASLHEPLDSSQVRDIYIDFYQAERFVHVLPAGQWPRTKWVTGSNNCYLQIAVDERTGRLIVVSVIDNLVKGASGQAVQNMNLLFGFDEAAGLDVGGMFP